jgi:hypothetical protein
LGVELARALERERLLVRSDRGYSLGRHTAALDELEIDLDELERRRRPIVRACLDWSERELHLGGGLGATITARLFALDWIKRRRGSRAVVVTPAGAEGLRATFGLELERVAGLPIERKR